MNCPRELTVACHRSSTPAGDPPEVIELALVRSPHVSVPAAIAFTVVLRCDALSTPSAPNEIAEKLRCCHQATSFVQLRSPAICAGSGTSAAGGHGKLTGSLQYKGCLPDEDGTLFIIPGRKSVAQ